MIVWPADLPQRMRVDGFSTTMPDARQKASMDYGPAKMGVRSSLAVRPVAGTMRFQQADVARFHRFWWEELNKGTKRFLFPDQVFDNAFLLNDAGDVLQNEDGVDLLVASWWVVQMPEAARIEPIQGSVRYAVQLSLSVIG